MSEENFIVTEYLNCRKFNKRYYNLYKQVDYELINSLEILFGIAQIQCFSKFSPTSKDTFQIKNQDGIQVNGVISADLLYLVTPLKDQGQIDKFENIINSWANCQKF